MKASPSLGRPHSRQPAGGNCRGVAASGEAHRGSLRRKCNEDSDTETQRYPAELMQPSVALTLIEMGRELIGVETVLNLGQGLEKVRRLIEQKGGARE